MGFLAALETYESGGRNVQNNNQTTSSGRAQGYDQITTGTWNEFAPSAGIDLSQYPSAISAPPNVQRQVAATIPLERWDPKTLNYLRSNGYSVQPNLTLGANIAANNGSVPGRANLDYNPVGQKDDPFAGLTGAVATSAAAGMAPRPAAQPQSSIDLNYDPTGKADDPFAQPAPAMQGITVDTPVGSASGSANFTARPAGVAPQPSLATGSINPFGSALAASAAQGASATSPATSEAQPSALMASGGGLEFMNSIPIVGPGILAAGAGVNSLVNGNSYANERALQQQQMAQFQSQNPGTALGARIAGGIVGSAPLMAVAPALGIGGNALLGAGVSGADTAARGGSVPAIGANAAFGGAVGGLGAAIGSGVGAIGRGLSGGLAPTDDAALAATAVGKYNIPLTADQIGTGAGAKFVRSTSDRLPFSGAGSDIASTQAAFNRAAINEMGESADRATPDVMNAAKARIGGYYNSVAANTNINVDPQFLQGLHDTLNNASQVLPKSEVEPLIKQAQNILSTIDPQSKTISGATYQALTNTGAPLDRLASSPNPNLGYYANQLKTTLDSALERSAPPDQQALLQTADKQWAAMRTI